MIAWLKGQIIDNSQPGKLVLDVQGVGYDVEVSLQSFFQLSMQNEKAISLYIHTVVREDAFLLFGFLDKEERSVFRALIKINGIGPKVAMAILSSITATEFAQSIQREDVAMLKKLPGVGPKTAQRLIIEMRDSFKELEKSHSSLPNMIIRPQDEAISALQALGYKPQEASQMIKKIDDGEKTCEQLIRHALQLGLR